MTEPPFDEYFPLSMENGRRRYEWIRRNRNEPDIDPPCCGLLSFGGVHKCSGFVYAYVQDFITDEKARLWLFPSQQPKFLTYKAQLPILQKKECEVLYWKSKKSAADWFLIELVITPI